LEAVSKNLAAKIKQDNQDNIDQINFLIPKDSRAIVADLYSMNLSLYENGQLAGSYKILSVGKRGSPWETPVGRYSVITKEENHFSSIGGVWMPYSLQFFGNFFIHGWPYYSNGTPVPRGFSGGCIRLDTNDAKEIFNFSKPSIPVLILNNSEDATQATLANKKFYYLKSDAKNAFPKISADAFLVADLKNNAIILSKNKDKKLAIASITKLMTAVVSLESIDQYKPITITKKMVNNGNNGKLTIGETMKPGELIFPLLLSSSNDAAIALAEYYGRENFVKLMNEKSNSIGLSNTYFEEPSGISDNNKSTPEDLFHLIQYLYNSKRYVLDVTKLKKVNEWKNTNFFAGDKRFLGGKLGYTNEALQTSAAVFSLPLSEFENQDIAIILLHSNNWKNDTASILNWLQSEVIYGQEIPAEIIFSQKEIKGLKIISLLFVGDIMLDRDVRESVIKNANGDFSFLFKNVDFLKNADITFGNLEGPISDLGENIGNLYSFRAHPSTIDALKETGFDILSVANNHIGDWGKIAAEDTILRLESESIMAANNDLKIIEKQGIKIGFLAFSDSGPEWVRVPENFETIIKTASEQVDVLVVSLHFGEEYQNKPNERQIKFSHQAIDNGAKIVVGHHPHHIQDIEIYKEGVIAYSLGNFVFDQIFSEETMKGMVLEIIISGDGKIKSVNKNIVRINKFYQPELMD